MGRLGLIGLAISLALFSSNAKADGIGPLSEVRLGLFGHDIGYCVTNEFCIFSNRKETAKIAVNGELLFKAPTWSFDNRVVNFLLTPRPHIGGTVNFDNSTDLAYAGVTWQLFSRGRFFLDFGFGAALNNGDLRPTRRGRKAIGSRVLLHEKAALGFRVTERVSVMATFHHVSNAGLADHNGGLDHAGVQIGFSF